MNALVRARLVLLVMAVSTVSVTGCGKKDPPPPITVTHPDPAPVPTPAPAPDAPPAQPDPADVKVEKSAELRFIEANAALVCFERTNKHPPKDKDRADVLKAHGFAGKAGEQAFLELSIRGEKDRDWGRRTAERISAETQSLCPAHK